VTLKRTYKVLLLALVVLLLAALAIPALGAALGAALDDLSFYDEQGHFTLFRPQLTKGEAIAQQCDPGGNSGGGCGG
jgi:hypothetical protein